MSSHEGLHTDRGSRRLERLTGAALFVGSALWVLWQNTRVAVLWDLSYLLDSAWRFSVGQVPYRDLPFAHAPLTFLIQAVLIHVFGRVYWPHVAYAALAGGCGTLLTWRLLVWVVRPLGARAWQLAAVLAIPLVPLGIYGVYPHPIYDSDCILTCLLGLFLVIRAVGYDTDDRGRRAGEANCVLAGAACAVPVFAKQNIGIPFFGALMAATAIVAIGRRVRSQRARRESLVIVGALAGLGCAVLVLHATVGLGNYIHWTVQFAAQRRLPGIGLMLGAYRVGLLVWGLPCVLAGAALLSIARLRMRTWASVAAAVLIATSFLWTAFQFAMDTDADDRADHLLALWPLILVLAILAAAVHLRRGLTLRTLLPWILLATIHGAFLSQQLWGSTYACWPFLMLLIGGLVVPLCRVRWAVAAVVCCTLAVCGGLYSASLERLSYIHMEGARGASSLPALRGMRTPGPWLPGLDELVQLANSEIPARAGVLLIPGEDPFFFATGRVPVFPALLFDRATYPYTPEQTVNIARETGVQWLIVKRQTQLMAAPYDAIPAITAALMQDFTLYRRLALYDVYQRK